MILARDKKNTFTVVGIFYGSSSYDYYDAVIYRIVWLVENVSCVVFMVIEQMQKIGIFFVSEAFWCPCLRIALYFHLHAKSMDK